MELSSAEPSAPSRDFALALSDGGLVFDGPMGTLLLARGHRPPLEELNVTAPHEVRAAHDAYLASGAKVLRANTLLARRGEVSDPETSARRGLEIARAAARHATWVGASVGAPRATRTASRPVKERALLSDAFAAQARSLSSAAFLSLETFLDPADLDLALAACRGEYAGPVLAFFTLTTRGPTRLDSAMSQRVYVTVGEFVDVAARHDVAVLGVNCIPPGGQLELARDSLARLAGRSWGILPAVGVRGGQPPGGRAAAASSVEQGGGAAGRRRGVSPAVRARGPQPDEGVVAASEAALDSGASFVGVCCGGTPETVRRLARLVARRTREVRDVRDVGVVTRPPRPPRRGGRPGRGPRGSGPGRGPRGRGPGRGPGGHRPGRRPRGRNPGRGPRPNA